MVKEDVKKMRKYTKDLYNDSDSDGSEDELTRTEDKIYYGSDSDTSQQSAARDLPEKLRDWD